MSTPGATEATAERGQALPRPRKSRWQPLRSGLLNLYRYDHEEFWYEDGHLLLRGNNGTGKSRVLALQLPFLLDGEVAPHRMEPDGDPAKRAEWNLLMGKHADRLGYTWLELGRRNDDDDPEGPGHEHYLTLGCGLSAVSGRGAPERWFFLTGERVGRDFFLQGQAGGPLTRPRLTEALGETGQIFTTAAEYRAEVDRRLFQLGPQRYGALVDLLIQLRQPQLSRKLDEERLSSALSNALPPIDQQILTDVAESFRGLDADRGALEILQAAVAGVEQFLKSYRRYAAVAIRRRAEGVRSAHASYESTQRRLREAEQQHAVAERRLAEVDSELEQLELGQSNLETEARTLEARPEMRDKQALDAARRRFEERRLQSEQAHRETERAREAERQQKELLRGARSAEATARATAHGRLETAGQRAVEAVLETAHGPITTPLAPGEPVADDVPGDAEALEKMTILETANQRLERAEARLEEIVDRRQRGVRHVRRLHEVSEEHRQRLKWAREEEERRDRELEDARETVRRAVEAAAGAVDELVEAYRVWRADLEELEVPGAAELDEALREWAREGEGPVTAAARRARHRAVDALARLAAELEGRRTAENETRDTLLAESEALRAGVHTPPPAPHTRAAERQGRPGAPLWKVCDFATDTTPETRAGLEAALEAAGLLDAWITPEGTLLAADEHDTVLVTTEGEGDPRDAVSGDRLDRYLCPELVADDASLGGLGPAVVLGVLRQIRVHQASDPAGDHGETQGEIWVRPDGRFRLGPLHGAWAKPAAQHIGQGAREADRKRRLAELEGLLAAADERLVALDREAEALRSRRRTLDHEHDSAPDEEEIRRTALAAETARHQEGLARQRRVEAERRVAEHRRAHEAALSERDRAAEDLGIAEHLEDLQRLEDGVVAYRQALIALWPALRAHLEARRILANEKRRLREAEEETARRQASASEARRLEEAARSERDTLELTVGAGVREILDRLEATREQLGSVRRQLGEARKRRENLLVERARAESAQETEGRTLEDDGARRDRRVDGLRALARSGLVGVGLPEIGRPRAVDEAPREAAEGPAEEPKDEALVLGDPDSWSTTRAVELARQFERRLEGVAADDRAWELRQGEIHRRFKELSDELSAQGYQPELVGEGELVKVTAVFQARPQTMDLFHRALASEVEARQRVLAEREREVIENHLLIEMASHLHQRLRAAEELVNTMNQQIERRPMSTGMTLRFRWRPRHDAELDNIDHARRLLMSERGIWSPADSKVVGDFLQGRIDGAKIDDSLTTWQEQLASAFDYRAWHRFDVERKQEGTWHRLTRRTHGTGSGGEKAIALTVPQFAAASAHYDTAHPHAPRLILLDEAFVGVDADMRAKCMGLLEAFDLDFMMTSEREWGCYETLPGVAIYQLSTRPGIDAVGVTRWLWNGKERQRDAVRASPSAPPPPEQPDVSQGPSLFNGLE